MTYTEPKYPLFVDIDGATVKVIGAGKVAERKIETLLNYHAQVTVIAPEATDRIMHLAKHDDLKYLAREYLAGDVADAFLVICATDSREVNEQVYKEAIDNNILVNVVDVPELCNFYVPSIVKRGPLQIAISTSGAAPTVAKQLRKQLSKQYGDEWAEYVTLLGEVRALVLSRVSGGEDEHKPLFSSLAQSNMYDRVCSGELLSAESVYKEYIVPLLEKRKGGIS